MAVIWLRASEESSEKNDDEMAKGYAAYHDDWDDSTWLGNADRTWEDTGWHAL